MRLIKKYGLYIVSCLLFLDSFFVIYGLGKFRVYTISILMPLIIIYYYKNSKRSKKSITFTNVLIALILVFASDIIYLINNFVLKNTLEWLFVLRICLLLVANLVFGYIFNHIKKLKISKCPEAFISILITIPLALVLFKFLKVVDLGNYKYPILIAMLIMVFVIALATNVFGDKAKKSIAYESYIPGTFSLALSLGLIAVYKFLIPDVDFLPAVITLTQGFGYLLLVSGFVKYLKA